MMFKRPPLPIHWVHRGEIACGAKLTAKQAETRAKAERVLVTCPECLRKGEAHVVILPGKCEARVVVNGRVVARCDAMSERENEGMAVWIANALNGEVRR